MDNKTLNLGEGSVKDIVFQNAIPGIASMIMVLVYNLADTFFIGQTNNDFMVAAVSLGTPVFLILSAFGTLFGIGGTSLISRSLGAKDYEYADHVSAFCMWSCVGIGAVCMILAWIFMEPLVVSLGASDETLIYTKEYLTIVAAGSIFSMISGCFSNIIRAEGKPKTSMNGMILGNLLNVILDPILILFFGWGMKGAAIATVIGQTVSAMYYLYFYMSGKSMLSIRLRDFSVKGKIIPQVFAIGIPASLTNLLMSVAAMITNSLMAGYGDMSVAAYGVASKILMIVSMVAVGLGQSIQPILGFCYGAGMKRRMKEVMRFSIGFGLLLCSILTVACFIFSKPLVNLFLTDQGAMEKGIVFVRIMLSTMWFIGIFFVLMNTLQAIGAATPSLVVSLGRQGFIYIPAVFLLGKMFGIYGLAWTQPTADILSTLMVAYYVKRALNKMSEDEPDDNAEGSEVLYTNSIPTEP